MPARNILIVAVDGLRASALGAYGNTTFSTPALDDLAAQSLLLDFCFTPTAELATNYRALWQAVHPFRVDGFAVGAAPLPPLLAERGYATTLVTDEARLLVLPGSDQFGEVVHVSNATEQRATDIPQTAMARLFVRTCEIVEMAYDEPQLVWLHARGMTGPWDAPIELQLLLLDEGDPPPSDDIRPPDCFIRDVDDPDTAFRHGVAYSAQIMVLDACWQLIHDAVTSASRHGEWLVMFLGVRGMPLGEHHRVGGVDPRLAIGQIHVPWLIKFPDGLGRLVRTNALVSPLDLVPTIQEWIDRAEGKARASNCDGTSALALVETANAPWREVLLCGAASGHRAFRTTGWSLRYEAQRGAEGAELFVRPDDRWEANNVAVLCPEILEGLQVASNEMAARIQAGEPMPAERLPEKLRALGG